MYKQPKPIIRQNNHVDFHSAIQTAVDNVIKNPMTMPYQNCLNCKHWKPTDDICGLYKAKPPTEIIVYSCPSYEDDMDIPF